MGRKKKLSASYSIELTELDRKLAHKGLNDLEKPNIWSFARAFYHEINEPLIIDGYVFIVEEPDNIFNMPLDKKQYPRLKAFVQWLVHNCPRASTYESNPRFGLRETFEPAKLVRLSPQNWAIHVDRLGWVGIDLRAGGWAAKPEPKRIHGRQVFDTNWKLFSDKDDRIVRLFQIIDEFPSAWKIARNLYRNELRESGELLDRMNRDKDEQAVVWTQTRMEVAVHAAALKDGLDEVMHHLENGTITGTHFAEVDKLIEAYTRYAKGVRQNYKHMMRRNKRQKR